MSRIKSLHFRIEISLHMLCDPLQLYERCVSDEFQNALVSLDFIFHNKLVSLLKKHSLKTEIAVGRPRFRLCEGTEIKFITLLSLPNPAKKHNLLPLLLKPQISRKPRHDPRSYRLKTIIDFYLFLVL